MDWKNNQWVGIGAAAALVLGIVGIFVLRGGDGADSKIGSMVYTFQCQGNSQTFTLDSRTVDKMEPEEWAQYMRGYGADVHCNVCGGEDAKLAFYCEVCEKWYPTERIHNAGGAMICPEGHGGSN